MRIQRPLEFACNPPNHLRAALLYGNNRSLQQFYLSCLKAALPSTSCVTIDTAKQLPTVATPSLFAEENNQQLVFLSTAGERDLSTIQSFIADPSHHHLLIIASSLLTKSKLVSAFLEHKSHVAIACYDLKPQELKTYIQLSARKRNLQLTPDALTFLAETFVPFPELLLSELEKLTLYQLQEPKPLDIETVKSMTGLNSQLDLDSLIQAILLGDSGRLITSLSAHLIEEEFILIVRALIRNCTQLFELLAHIRKGLPFAKAVESLSAPIFFQLKPTFAQAAERWSLEQCAFCLEQLLLLEKAYKNQELNWTDVQAYLLKILPTS